MSAAEIPAMPFDVRATDEGLSIALSKARRASNLLGENLNPQTVKVLDEADLRTARRLIDEACSFIRSARSDLARVPPVKPKDGAA